MTTYFAFTPSRVSAPTFQPTLDGAQYTCVARWNLFAQRYYLNCTDLDGNRIFALPIVETPPAIAINTLTWSELTGLVTVTTQSRHGYVVGGAVTLTIAGCSPDAYNGAQLVTITGASTFTYPLSSDPGTNIVAGGASQMINMGAGYFTTSSLIYRNGSFEVSP